MLLFFLFSVDYSVTKKSFGFAKKHKMPFYFVSASDGTNVVKVSKYEPRHEKIGCFLCKNKGVDQLYSNCTADQHLCFRYTNSMIPLLSESEISSLLL